MARRAKRKRGDRPRTRAKTRPPGKLVTVELWPIYPGYAIQRLPAEWFTEMDNGRTITNIMEIGFPVCTGGVNRISKVIVDGRVILLAADLVVTMGGTPFFLPGAICHAR